VSGTEETRLLVEDPDRLARDCARADHPMWDAAGCWCRQVTTGRLVYRDPAPRTVRLRIFGRGRG
jgi:hypothetical protein